MYLFSSSFVVNGYCLKLSDFCLIVLLWLSLLSNSMPTHYSRPRVRGDAVEGSTKKQFPNAVIPAAHVRSYFSTNQCCRLNCCGNLLSIIRQERKKKKKKKFTERVFGTSHFFGPKKCPQDKCPCIFSDLRPSLRISFLSGDSRG